MPELQMDVAVANRFISSLSKSLQALCHGCMDFDTGIEIVGYINVNIDCGSKVDYVLNEKVLKSTTNSMTFVSNSFLARKEQPKQTRDGTCSPIPELNPQPTTSPFQSRSREYFHGLHPRNVAPVSHSAVHRGGLKRSWAGLERDWRMSPKKQRDGRPFYPSSQEPSSAAQNLHSNTPSSSHNPSDSDFKYPQTSVAGSESSNVDSQSEINIKKEFLESDGDKETDQNEHDQTQTFDQNASDCSDQVPDVANIKKDPDASSADADDETSAVDQSANESNDYKDTFLEPSTSENNQAASEQNSDETCADDDNQTSSSSLARETSRTEELTQENAATGSEVQGEFDEGGEEGSYPLSVYSDAGEGSSDAGPFEVIEIDDEDEDVQAMFGGPRLYAQRRSRLNLSRSSSIGKSRKSLQHRKSLSQRLLENASPLLHTVEDSQCAQAVSDALALPVSATLDQDKPFCCPVCGKGFLSSTGFNLHMQAHEGRRFMCPVCDSKFNQKVHLKTHLKGVHKLAQCVTCAELLGLGVEYNQHVLHCHTTN